jgi:hypothetical protein
MLNSCQDRDDTIKMKTSLQQANAPRKTSKTCPYCAEMIQIQAIKCRYCGEFLDKRPDAKPKGKWYHSTTAVIIALASLGPLAFPLVWFNPRYNIMAKAIVTVGVTALSVLLFQANMNLCHNFLNQIQALGL